jgi:mono/diheme cytochrome c family protein
MRNALLLFALIGCDTDVAGDDPLLPRPPTWVSARTASGTVVPGPGTSDMLFADTDRGEISYAVNGNVQWSLPVGEEPTRMVRVGPSVYFTLREEGKIGYIDASNPTNPILRGTLDIGAEPFDIVALQRRDILMVSISQENSVKAVDPYTGRTLRSWDLDGEPRWMVTAEDGNDDVVYVALWNRPVIAKIIPRRNVVEYIPLPTIERFVDPSCMQRDFDMRLTGGLAIDGDDLYIPALYVDTELLEDPLNMSCPELTSIVQLPAQPEVPYYAPPAPPIDEKKPDRVNPVLVHLDIGTDVFQHVYHLGSLDGPANNAGTAVRGIPGDVSLVRDGTDLSWIAVPLRNHDHVVFVDMRWRDPLPSTTNFDERHTYTWRTGHGPRAVFAGRGSDPVLVALAEDDRVLSTRHVSDGMGDFLAPHLALNTMDEETLAPSTFTAEQLAGRKLFNTTVDNRMVLPNAGTSCSMCHDESRSDSQTWFFEDFPRQPPSLAGNLHDTAPFTWTGDVATVADEVENTSEVRMGGAGLDAIGMNQITAYLDTLRAPIRPENDGSAELVLGEQLFNDAVVGCAICHTGDSGADGPDHQVLGFPGPTNTPALRGIGSSAPYFHDGSAQTLRDVLERVRDGSMGNTAHLTDVEMDALEAYLKTL